jgi:acetyl esterase/lipase
MYRRASYRRVIDLRPSLRSRAYSAALRLMLRTRITPDTDIAALRRQFEKLDARHVPLDRSIVRTPVECNGVPAEWISVPESRADRVLCYFHGGSFAFRFANAHAALVARLCRSLHARALLPEYRLAPEHPWPAAPDDCHAAYRFLLGQGIAPSDLVVAGDSAGGNLALVTLQRARNGGEPMPACAILLSPALDCTMGSPSMAHFDGVDPLLRLSALLVMRRHYVPTPELYMHPEVSPLFGDFAGLPPLFFQVGSTEILRDEAERAAEKADAAGVDVELELWPDAPHVFQIAEFLPESSIALAHITRFVRMRTGWADLAR